MFQQTRRGHFLLASLKPKTHIHLFLMALLGKNNDDGKQFALRIWSFQDQALDSYPDDEELLDCISLALTDF